MRNMYSSEIKLCTQGKGNKKRASDIERSYVKHRERLKPVLKRKTGWSTNNMIR